MANSDQTCKDGITWSSAYKEIGISAQSLDNGTDNTKNIIAAYPYPADSETNNAAYLCIKYKDQPACRYAR